MLDAAQEALVASQTKICRLSFAYSLKATDEKRIMNVKTAHAGIIFVCGIFTLTLYCNSTLGQAPFSTASNLPSSSEYACIQRGPNSRVWQSATLQANGDGIVTTNLHSYTELATGICYHTNGQYVDSVEQVVPIPGGAQAVQGRHQVQWNANANTPGGAVVVTTPDGKQIESTVFGIAYYDVATGSNTAVAWLQDCTGSIAQPNQVVYEDAFSNLTADICYTYSKAGLSQDIDLRKSPLPPDAYGLSDSTTVLQIYTEFFNTTDPVATVATNGNSIDDEI